MKDLTFAAPVILCIGLVSGAFVPVVTQFHATAVDTTHEDEYLKMTLEYIAANRTHDVRILLIDNATGQPLTNAHVDYKQTTHDFIFAANGPWPFTDLWQQLGADSNELPLQWGHVEPAKGIFNFQEPDSDVNAVSKLGVDRLIVELRVYPEPGPTWVPPAWVNWKRLLTNSSFFNDYKGYVYEFVYNSALHLRSKVKVWETQMEYNWRRCDSCGPPGPWNSYYAKEDYYPIPFTVEQSLELTKIQAKAIRDAIPDAFILLGTSDPMKLGLNPIHYNGRIDPLDWAKMALVYGVDFDGVGIAANYANGPPSVFYNYLREFLKLGKPAWNNEARYPAAPLVKGTEFQSDQPHWTTFNEETQALWLKYMVTYTFAFGFGFNWYPFNDLVAPNPGYPASINKDGLVDANGHPRKAYYVYQTLIRQFATNGTSLTDAHGHVTFRGFAGNYSISVEGYDVYPSVVHVSEGKQNTFTLIVRSLALRQQASQILAKTYANLTAASGGSMFHSSEAKDLLIQAFSEYEVAGQMFKSHDYTSVLQHAQIALDLLHQAYARENEFQQMEQRQRIITIVEIAAGIAVPVVAAGALVIYLGKRKRSSSH